MRYAKVIGTSSSRAAQGFPSSFVAEVADVNPASGRVGVRLRGTSGRTIRHLWLPEGQNLNSGDHVLVTRTTHDPGWAIAAKIVNTKEYGLTVSPPSGGNEVHPPSNFSVTGIPGAVLASWDCWAGSTICWEVQHNSTNQSTGASTSYTRGAYFIYPTRSDTRYIRIRAVRYDVQSSTTFYSGWTEWASSEPSYNLDIDFAQYAWATESVLNSVGVHISNTETFPDTLAETVIGGWLLYAVQGDASGAIPSFPDGVSNPGGPAMLLPLYRAGDWTLTITIGYSSTATNAQEGHLYLGYITGSNVVGAMAEAFDTAPGAVQMTGRLKTYNGSTFTTRYTGTAISGAGERTFKFACKNGVVGIWDDYDDSWHWYTGRQATSTVFTPAYAFVQTTQTTADMWTVSIRSLRLVFE